MPLEEMDKLFGDEIVDDDDEEDGDGEDDDDAGSDTSSMTAQRRGSSTSRQPPTGEGVFSRLVSGLFGRQRRGSVRGDYNSIQQ